MATDTPNLIPGLSLLGWSFDISGHYNPDSAMKLLYAFSDQTHTISFEDKSGRQISYLYPTNIPQPDTGVAEHSAKAAVFRNEVDYSDAYSLRAGLGASSKIASVNFSGQFEASFGRSFSRKQEMWHGVHELYSTILEAKLTGVTDSDLASWVQGDEIYQNVPSDPFTPQNAEGFFRFFARYGTHYVQRVYLGGRLYYNVSIQRVLVTDETDMAANISIEFDAVFGAEGGAGWKQLSSTWTESRQVHVEALGGTSAVLTSLNPQPGDNHHNGFEDWLAGIYDEPAIIDFRLALITDFFDADRQGPVGDALAAYLQGTVDMTSGRDRVRTVVAGVEQPATAGANTAGAQVIVIDRSSGSEVPVANEVFSESWQDVDDNVDQFFDGVYDFLVPKYDSERYIIGLAFWGMMGLWVPTYDLYNFLLSCGAGRQLHDWAGLAESGYSWSGRQVNYVLIGVPRNGLQTGYELLHYSEDGSYQPDMVTIVQPSPRAVQIAPAARKVVRIYSDLGFRRVADQGTT